MISGVMGYVDDQLSWPGEAWISEKWGTYARGLFSCTRDPHAVCDRNRCNNPRTDYPALRLQCQRSAC